MAVLAGAVASLWLGNAPAAQAADNAQATAKVDTAVWWRYQTDAATLPAPPEVPARGLWVSSDPTGPSAISAVRIALAETDAFTTLTLRVARLSSQPAAPRTTTSAPIRVCPVTRDWATPVTFPGRWSTRPAYDCSKGSIPGRLSPDRTTVAFDLKVLPAAHHYNVVVIPDTSVGAVGSPTFDVTFEPVRPSDLSVIPISAASTSAPVPAAAASPADTAVAPVPLASPDMPAADVAVAPVPPAAATPVVLPVATRVLALPSVHVGGASRTHRVIAALVFCALAAWAVRLLRAPTTTGRDVLTLYDYPLATQSSPLRRFTAGGRTGAPPGLR
ncbi:MAG: hypothetical protein ACYDH6_00715 [Acidimicrobiales bacterium]